MKTKTVRIDDIETYGRRVNPQDYDWHAFRDQVRHDGIEVPPLVDEHNRLIDGLRRIMSLDPATKIEVLVSENFNDTLDYLMENMVPVDRWTPRRMWEFFVATADQRAVHSAANQVNVPRAIRGKPLGDRNLYTRGRISAVTGRSQHWIQCVTTIYRRATGEVPEDEKWEPTLRRLAEYLDGGGNPYSAMTEWRKVKKADAKTIVSEGQQRLVLSRSVSTLRGVIQGIDDLGTLNNRLKPEERAQFAEEFRKVNRALRIAIRKLSEGTGN